MGARGWTLAALLALAPAPLPAQEDLSMGQVRSPVLTIDVDRLLEGTAFGRRLAEDIRLRAEALDEENERLRAELTEEERALTERRPSMEVDAFRAEAEAFDERVQQIRAQQDAKQEDLSAAVEEGRREFLNAISPVLAGLMVESGAAVILERQNVFLGAAVIDVTDEAIVAIDSELGDGRAPPAAPDEPLGVPDPEPPAPTEPEVERGPGGGPTAEEAGPAIVPEAGAAPPGAADGD